MGGEKWSTGVLARPHRYAKRCGRESWSNESLLLITDYK
jgi:hypothetical protein